MATLAIKGHKTRGREVIELLEMLGGKNRWNYSGDSISSTYYLNNDKIIYYCNDYWACAYEIFTLESFLEKFPYKVWDKVKTSSSNDNCVGTIISMRWDDGYNEVVYTVKWDDIINSVLSYRVQGLQPYKEQEPMEEQKLIPPYMDYDVRTSKEEPMEETRGILVEIDLTEERLNDKVEIILDDNHEVKIEDGKVYIVKKQYPKTYEECCRVLELSNLELPTASGYGAIEIEALQQLRVCRDAYWKLAEDWRPSPKSKAYNIVFDLYGVAHFYKVDSTYVTCVFSFPTKEMRDAFYENFKELIETCKELL